MLRHIVLLTLTADTPPEIATMIADALRKLPAQIPCILGHEVGVDLGLCPGNATVGVVARFEDDSRFSGVPGSSGPSGRRRCHDHAGTREPDGHTGRALNLPRPGNTPAQQAVFLGAQTE
jgi:hypothetical protein